ncbi:MAG: hypothetical protein LBG07_11810 [Treponema sp.]|jgi:hypothetical protein|nr:hypothetical protein [Treponema sp.]
MIERILHLEIEGKRRLGFDTGLSSQAFAQAKLAHFITQGGAIVLPGGGVIPWQPSGVIEREGTMVVWGPGFAGERLDRLLDPAALTDGPARSRALEALGYWIDAYPWGGTVWPAGVLVSLGPPAAVDNPEAGLYPQGTVFFPPEGLRLRVVQAEGEESWLAGGESLVCRDLTGEAAVSFSAAAMLYRILALEKDSGAGALPFPAKDKDLLHQDMREGVFLPLGLAAPGLDPKAAELVDRALAGIKEPMTVKRPPLAAFAELLKEKGAAHGPASFFRELGGEELEKLREERLRYEKKRKLAVGTRRFVVRNTAILTGAAAALVIAVLVVNSFISARRDRPNTAGMDSRQVVESYYDAFGELDHTLMEACVLNKAGKGDIDMVTRFFVTTKVRQAYEYTALAVIPAQDWFEMGAPPTATPIIGVTDLAISRLAGDEAGDEISYRARYILWIPGPADENDEGPPPVVAVPGPGPEQGTEQGTGRGPEQGTGQGAEQGTGQGTALPPGAAAPGLVEFIPPLGYSFTDELILIRHKGNWRIAKINRSARSWS